VLEEGLELLGPVRGGKESSDQLARRDEDRETLWTDLLTTSRRIPLGRRREARLVAA
jgi:hypothetical protein